MHENMINLENILVPTKPSHTLCKWIIISLSIISGICIFLTELPAVLAYERACEHPAYVDATIRVEQSGFFLESYDSFLSYTYNDITYENVFYRGNQNPGMLDDDGEIITISINPNKPDELARDMVHESLIIVSLILFSSGVSLFLYSIAIKNSKILIWRTSANRTQRNPLNPDYLKDLFILFLPIYFFTVFVFAVQFPYTIRNVI